MIKCRACQYWRTVSQNRVVGHCCRKAPTPGESALRHLKEVGLQPRMVTAIWPVTHGEDGCGEGRKRWWGRVAQAVWDG